MNENIDMVGLAHEAAGMEPVTPEALFWTKLEGLPSMMKALAQARENYTIAVNYEERASALIERTSEYRAFMEAHTRREAAALARDSLDALVRKEALADFKANGEKAIYAGVSVKLFTRYDYDTTQMRAWAIEQKVFGLLTLDTKRTEKAAAAGVLDDAPITVTKEPRAIIASDLTAYLANPE